MTGQPDPGATSAEEHGAGVDLLVEQAPPGSVDRDREHREQTPAEDALQGAGPLETLRRGGAVTPELRVGLLLPVALALAPALRELAVSVLIQTVLGRWVIGDGGFRHTIAALVGRGE